MRLYVYLFTCLFFSCQIDTKTATDGDTGKELQRNSISFIRPMNDRTGDTIINNNVYETRLYFNRDSLIQVARNNGIEKYLAVVFGFKSLNGEIVQQEAKLQEDTAFVSIDVNLPDLSEDDIIEFRWMYKFKVDWKPERNGYDTTFTVIDKFYVKGS